MAHEYRPHSHRTWTIAVVQRGAARFTVDSTRQRASAGELFVLEPEAVHTGMAAVPEGWAYKVLYLDPAVLRDFADGDGPGPRAARWVVFRDPRLRAALLDAHAALASSSGVAGVGAGGGVAGAGAGGGVAGAGAGGGVAGADAGGGVAGADAGGGVGLEVEEKMLAAIAGLTPHLRNASAARVRLREHGEHTAVRRARVHLQERWDQPVSLAELAAVAGLSRFELIRRFRRQNGLTPHAFQRDLRIDHARTMLGDGVPVAAVAASCGFADQPHLSRVFKRLVGVSPGAYARA